MRHYVSSCAVKKGSAQAARALSAHPVCGWSGQFAAVVTISGTSSRRTGGRTDCDVCGARRRHGGAGNAADTPL